MKRIVYILFLLLIANAKGAVGDSVKINFASSTYPTSQGNWNNLTNYSQGTTHSNLINHEGDATTIDLYVVSSGIYTVDQGYYPGLYPDSVMRSVWQASGAIKQIRLEDLDVAVTYKIEIFGSRTYASTYLNEFTISSTAQQLDVHYNTSNTISLTFQPTYDTVNIYWKSITGSYGFLNAMVIIEQSTEAETPPEEYPKHYVFFHGENKLSMGSDTKFRLSADTIISTATEEEEEVDSQILFYENFEDLSDLNWSTVQPLWNANLVGIYLDGSQSLVDVGGDRNYVWESTFHDGKYGGQDGYDLNSIFDTVIYDDVVCESMWLWAESGWTGTSQTGKYSGKIAHGIVGGYNVHGDWYGEGFRFQTVWTSVDRLRAYIWYPIMYTGVAGPATTGTPAGDTTYVPKGFWAKYSKCVQLNTPGTNDGILAFFENDTLVYYADTCTIRLDYDDPDSVYGIGGLYIKYMWGGSGADYMSDGDNTIRSDDFLVWIDGDFPETLTNGETILTQPDYPANSVYMTKTFFADSTYTAAADTIYLSRISDNQLYPDDEINIWTATIEGTDINITFEQWDDGYMDSPAYRVSYVKVYTVVGDIRTLEYEFGYGQIDGNPSLGVPISLEATEVQIDYFIGSSLGFYAKISYDND